MRRKGLIVVISAPSGAGKSTLCGRLMRRLPRLKYSISYTTRQPRPGEKNGREYCFVSEEKFKEMARRGKFVEWACVHGYYYGTPRQYIEKTVRAGNDVILDIDVQGGKKIRKAYPETVMIFVMAPSLRILEQRLRARKKDSEEVIGRRLANARRELKCLPEYSYLVINKDVSEAVRQLEAVIAAEHLRVSRASVPEF